MKVDAALSAPALADVPDAARRIEAAGYDGLDAHRKHHAVYLKNIAELKEQASLPRIQGASYDLSATTNQVVVDWIVDHIMKIDRQFGEYMKNRKQ